MEKVVAVQVLCPYVIEVTFHDGTRRRIDMEPELWGEVFAPLRDPALFAQAAVDPTFGSVFWPTGADLAPELLYYGEAGPPPRVLRPRRRLGGGRAHLVGIAMTDPSADPIAWRSDWDVTLAEARATRRVVLIDVWKDP